MLVTDPDNPASLYCAGLFEGEGTIYSKLRKKQGSTVLGRVITLRIAMTNREPLELFEDIMQLGKIYGPYQYGKSHYKNVYVYDVNKLEEVKFVVGSMWNWLSSTRKLQCEEALGRYNWKAS